ncbi:MAG: ATP-binding protein [Planctomycetes bacterium]|nr:ATP-binding protein [Planctomycetota bacterium]
MVDDTLVGPAKLADAIQSEWEMLGRTAPPAEIAASAAPEPSQRLLESAEIARLFEDFSRATSQLVAAHEALQAQVDLLKEELAQKNRRLERKKRLEALGRVAAGVAHEFRNPLGGVRLTIDALLKDAPSERGRARLEHVKRAVLHLNRIVEDLLSFARNRPLERTRAFAAALVSEAVEIAFPPDALVPAPRIVREGPPELELSVDPHAFTQVLVNLMVNAAQALSDPSRQSIGIFWGTDTAGRRWLEVADEGKGIPAGDEEAIFHPFHTSRPGGTGLGLAIVHDRVEAHEGEIAVVRDAWGGGAHWSGARFRILLPAQPSVQEV